MGGVGGPWVEVGGLWTPVPTRDLSSDRSERKLLPNGSPSAADYAEVEGGHSSAQLKDDFTKAKLGMLLYHSFIKNRPVGLLIKTGRHS